MSAIEPSEERVERAARKIDPWAWKEFERGSPFVSRRRDESLSAARAALLADAPALVEARIAGMRGARDLAAQQLREGRALLAVPVINHTITALQADLDKERGKTT